MVKEATILVSLRQIVEDTPGAVQKDWLVAEVANLTKAEEGEVRKVLEKALEIDELREHDGKIYLHVRDEDR